MRCLAKMDQGLFDPSRRLPALALVYDGGQQDGCVDRIGGDHRSARSCASWVLLLQRLRTGPGWSHRKSHGLPPKLNADHRRARREVVEAGQRLPAATASCVDARTWRGGSCQDVRHLARRDHGRAAIFVGALRQDHRRGRATCGRNNELAVEAFKLHDFPAECSCRRSGPGYGPERRRLCPWWRGLKPARGVPVEDKLTRRSAPDGIARGFRDQTISRMGLYLRSAVPRRASERTPSSVMTLVRHRRLAAHHHRSTKADLVPNLRSRRPCGADRRSGRLALERPSRIWIADNGHRPGACRHESPELTPRGECWQIQRRQLVVEPDHQIRETQSCNAVLPSLEQFDFSTDHGGVPRHGIDLRNDFDSVSLRRLAKGPGTDPEPSSAGVAEVSRWLAGDASRIGGVGLQIIRDWVLRFNARGPTAGRWEVTGRTLEAQRRSPPRTGGGC